MTLQSPTTEAPSVEGVQSCGREIPKETIKTQVLPVNIDEIKGASSSTANIHIAVTELRAGRPVAFPTETVYGLGADATSSAAVRAIYTAKQRPADNPLIVHFGSTEQLRKLLGPERSPETQRDPIPEIYYPLIERFWPGPLTILIPLPTPSPLAPEVTNSLRTFGARMPASPIALALIQRANLPLAAPSANASGKPSPTTAQHVLEDMAGRIRVILDGGSCDVGVESTVVDGLCDPPCVLRPGGVSIEEVRKCPGWENVENAYAGSEVHQQSPDGSMNGGSEASAGNRPDPNGTTQTIGQQFTNGHALNGTNSPSHSPSLSPDPAPRAPGMKYRHYAPRAHVVLVDAGAWNQLDKLVADAYKSGRKKVAVLRTRSTEGASHSTASIHNASETEVVAIGPTVQQIARGLFAALRELDARGVDVIFVEGLDEKDEEGEAVMNRVRKAAGERIRGG
jgi:L-threonylcarbamoyladenylate synthase